MYLISNDLYTDHNISLFSNKAAHVKSCKEIFLEFHCCDSDYLKI